MKFPINRKWKDADGDFHRRYNFSFIQILSVVQTMLNDNTKLQNASQNVEL